MIEKRPVQILINPRVSKRLIKLSKLAFSEPDEKWSYCRNGLIEETTVVQLPKGLIGPLMVQVPLLIIKEPLKVDPKLRYHLGRFYVYLGNN